MEVSQFFSKLVRPKRPETPNQSRTRSVDAFKHAYQEIQGVLERPDEKQILLGIRSTTIPDHLKSLVDILVAEPRESDDDTGACLECFLNDDVFRKLVELAEADVPFGVKSLLVQASQTLVEALPERFLVHHTIHHCLRELVRSAIGDDRDLHVDGSARAVGAAAAQLDPRAIDEVQKSKLSQNAAELEASLVSLLVSVTERMALYPPLLLIIFSNKQPPHAAGVTTQMFDFVFLEYLLRFVHREGQIGEDARHGVLTLLDMVFDAGQGDDVDDPALRGARLHLGRHFLLGSLVDVLLAGVGAVYSTLPNKIRLPTPKERHSGQAGMHLDLAEIPPLSPGLKERGSDVMRWTDEALQDQLLSVARIISFIDDILERCDRGAVVSEDLRQLALDIRQAIHASSQSSFLENVLYASLLESSAHDGSATAVAMYLSWLVASPLRHQHPFLLSVSLRYLMGADVSKQEWPVTVSNLETARFSIKDFVIDVLASNEEEASEATLLLLSSLLDRFCSFTTLGVIGGKVDNASTILALEVEKDAAYHAPDDDGTTHRAPSEEGDHLVLDKSDMLGTSVATMSRTPKVRDADADAFKALLADASDLESYIDLAYDSISSTRCLSDALEGLKRHGGSSSSSRTHLAHRLNPQDPVIQDLIRLTRYFFRHSASFNIALTGVWSSLATCPCRSLVGWIRRDGKTTNDPFAADPDVPILLALIKSLASEFRRFRAQISDFDELLDQRRRGLLFQSGINDALHENLSTSNLLEEAVVAATPATPPASSNRRPFKLSSTFSFMSPKRSSSRSSESDGNGGGTNTPGDSATPTQLHYAATTHATVQPTIVKSIDSGDWSPRKDAAPAVIKTRAPAGAARGHGSDTVSMASSELRHHVRVLSQSDDDGEQQDGEPITLSSALDNCVVLEQFIKEIFGLVMARSILGIDGCA